MDDASEDLVLHIPVQRHEASSHPGERGSLCPTGVLPLLEVTAATMGYDMTVVEGGTLDVRDGVVYMMRAFGSGGRFGLIIVFFANSAMNLFDG